VFFSPNIYHLLSPLDSIIEISHFIDMKGLYNLLLVHNLFLTVKIAVTGTPGTGKTTVSNLFEEQGRKVLHLTEYVKEKGLGEQSDEFEVDVPQMKKALDDEDFEVVEGHLSHHVSVDVCIVLRTRPDVLRERLDDREYSKEKIEENVESEVLDVILSETVGLQEIVIEVDTTEKDAEEVFEEIKEKIDVGESDYGNFDCTEYL